MTKVKLVNVENATLVQYDKINKACGIIEKVVNSPEFKKIVLENSYTVRKCKGVLWWKKCTTSLVPGFTDSDETTKEIYDRIMSGCTDDDPKIDGTIDIRITVLKGTQGNVIGYTYPGADRTNTYAWVISEYTAAELAGHFFHEYLHRCHYEHFSATDYSSVPYELGNEMERLGAKYDR